MLMKDPAARAVASHVRANLAKILRRAHPPDNSFQRAVEELFHADRLEDRVAAVHAVVEMPAQEELAAAILSLFVRANPVRGQGLIPFFAPSVSLREIIAGGQDLGADSQAFDRSTSDIRTALFAFERLGVARQYLSGVDLSGMLLAGVDLQGADLRRADLRGAVLDGAKLRDCRLAYANLCHASLESTDLSNADLTGAWLEPVHVSKSTVLAGANLADAVFGIPWNGGILDELLAGTVGKPRRLYEDELLESNERLFFEALNFDRARRGGQHGYYGSEPVGK